MAKNACDFHVCEIKASMRGMQTGLGDLERTVDGVIRERDALQEKNGELEAQLEAEKTRVRALEKENDGLKAKITKPDKRRRLDGTGDRFRIMHAVELDITDLCEGTNANYATVCIHEVLGGVLSEVETDEHYIRQNGHMRKTVAVDGLETGNYEARVSLKGFEGKEEIVRFSC